MVRPAHVLRVFTRGDAGGNLLGVVNDTVGLSDDQMQAIAAHLGFSETTFVDWGIVGFRWCGSSRQPSRWSSPDILSWVRPGL